MTVSLTTAIQKTTSGQLLTNAAITQLNRLFQAARLCGYEYQNLSALTSALELCAQVSATSLIAKLKRISFPCSTALSNQSGQNRSCGLP